MAFIALAGGIKVSIEYTLNGEQIVNVFWLQTVALTPPTSTDLVNAATGANVWRLALRPMQSTALSCARIHCIDWSVADGESHDMIAPASPGGTNVGDPCPNNVAICQSFLTGLTGRSRHGRMYHSGITETMLTSNNLVTAASGVAINGAWGAGKASFDGNNLVHVVASFVHNGAPRAVGLATPIIAAAIDQPTDSQRRRLPGRGN